MNKYLVSLVITLCLLAPRLSAQDAPKKPSPEHKKLAIGVGNWSYTEEDFESPFGAAGKSTFTSESRMILGGFFYEERGKGAGPDGPYEWISINAYDSEKGYYGFGFDSQGVSTRPWKGEYSSGTVSGNTWTWTWKQEAKGKSYQCRGVNAFSGDGKTQTYEWSYSEDGKSWKPWLKGKGSRVEALRSY